MILPSFCIVSVITQAECVEALHSSPKVAALRLYGVVPCQCWWTPPVAQFQLKIVAATATWLCREDDTFNMDVGQILEKVTSRTKARSQQNGSRFFCFFSSHFFWAQAIICVHTYHFPVDMEPSAQRSTKNSSSPKLSAQAGPCFGQGASWSLEFDPIPLYQEQFMSMKPFYIRPSKGFVFMTNLNQCKMHLGV